MYLSEGGDRVIWYWFRYAIWHKQKLWLLEIKAVLLLIAYYNNYYDKPKWCSLETTQSFIYFPLLSLVFLFFPSLSCNCHRLWFHDCSSFSCKTYEFFFYFFFFWLWVCVCKGLWVLLLCSLFTYLLYAYFVPANVAFVSFLFDFCGILYVLLATPLAPVALCACL